MLKIIFIAIFLVLANVSCAEAENFPDKLKVAVMDFGQHSGAMTSELSGDRLGEMVSEYIVQALSDSGKFLVVDKDLPAEKFMEAGVLTRGIIPPSAAKKIAEILNVRYLIYGNLDGVDSNTFTLKVYESGGKFHTVHARVIMRMMDVTDGRIVCVAEGNGESKSSKVGVQNDVLKISVGRHSVSTDSVHSAIKKSAYSLVDEMVRSLWNVSDNKRRR